MNEAQEFYQESLKAYRESYEQQKEALSNVLTDLEKANYVVSGFILEVYNYAQLKDDANLLKIVEFHKERWCHLENIKLPGNQV